MSQIIIIGAGPAGITASLYAIRSKVKTSVIHNNKGSLLRADEIENFYGFSSSVTGEQLYYDSIENAKRLGVEFITEEVLSIDYFEKFTVTTNKNTYEADGIIIATGADRNVPKIDGLKKFDGKGVSYCAMCDGFFYRNKNVAVIGSGEYALHEARALSEIASNVTILSNGEEKKFEVPENISFSDAKIKKFDGDERLSKVVFDDGSALDVDGVFIAVGIAGSSSLAKKLGVITDGNNIAVDENMATNIPGLYCAGDCTGGLLQVSKSVYDGAKAGTELVKFLRNKNK